jgi:hypothetical protein
LEAVRVFSGSDYGETDASGYFNLGSRERVIRLSKEGYRPLTKLIADLRGASEVRMTQDAAGLWKPPLCSATKNGSVIAGRHMQFQVPRGARVRKGSDIDYSPHNVCRGRECLSHGWGPLWSSGIPPSLEKFVTGLSQIAERDVYNYDAPDFPGVEYRGVLKNGTYVRWVGILGETIDYEGVSKESAQLFDSLIDSFCWVERKP